MTLLKDRVRRGYPKALDLLISREATAYMNTWDLLTFAKTGPGILAIRIPMKARFG
jgi:hypothetical protein